MEEFYSNCHGAGVSPIQLPEYQCHKKVRAFKISSIEDHGDVFVLNGETSLQVCVVFKSFIDKHNPEIGGYYVRYRDGYESFSPADAFEDGYSLITDESNVSSCTPTAQEVTISKKEYFNLLQIDIELTALNNAGVDNWEGYDISRDYLDKIILDLEEGEFKTFMKQNFDL